MLAGVALLGSEMPAVTNLNDFINLYKLDAKFIRKYTIDSKGEIMPEDKKVIPEVEKKVEIEIEKKPAAAIPEVKAEEKKPFVMDPEMQKMIDELMARIAALEEEKKSSGEQIQKFKTDAEKTKIDNFMLENKYSPASRPFVEAILGQEKKEYSIQSGKETKNFSKFDLLKEFNRINSAGGVNLEENSQAGDSKPTETNEETLFNDLKKFASDNKLKMRDAYPLFMSDKDTSEVDEDEGEE
jgi:hypothetical protein